jgi:hypothetical protein
MGGEISYLVLLRHLKAFDHMASPSRVAIRHRVDGVHVYTMAWNRPLVSNKRKGTNPIHGKMSL